MPDLIDLLLALCFLAAWVGHACIWTSLLNNVYGQRFPKKILKTWRLVTGVIILAYPLLIASGRNFAAFDDALDVGRWNGLWGRVVLGYAVVCLIFGAVVFPGITLVRLLRPKAAALVAEKSETIDLWAELGKQAIGDGKGTLVTRLPLNGVFCVDFTEITLTLPDLPPAWHDLSIHLLSDIHFHGTPSRAFFERILSEIETRWPTPDLVCLAGDYLDSDEHVAWIEPLLGRLTAREAKLAILGNHDDYHHPDQVRAELSSAGYRVIGNGWVEETIRGEPCVVIGHEGPWFQPEPALADAPETGFRLCLSHTPDNFYWGRANRVQLMLCGHVHGGQIRVPVVGSIFIPSVYGRRFDMGVFEQGGTVMVVGRGLSGKEPLRFRCNPQVLRITLKPAPTG